MKKRALIAGLTVLGLLSVNSLAMAQGTSALNVAGKNDPAFTVEYLPDSSATATGDTRNCKHLKLSEMGLIGATLEQNVEPLSISGSVPTGSYSVTASWKPDDVGVFPCHYRFSHMTLGIIDSRVVAPQSAARQPFDYYFQFITGPSTSPQAVKASEVVQIICSAVKNPTDSTTEHCTAIMKTGPPVLDPLLFLVDGTNPGNIQLDITAGQ